jgi:predicted O-linked N-acetylglucosamine transferase (SPINDLY family)
MPPKLIPVPKKPGSVVNPVMLQMQDRLKQAVAWHQQNQLTQAKLIYEDILRKAPKHFDALNLLGVIAMQTQDFTQALELFRQAVALCPQNAVFYFNQANALSALARTVLAVASYDKAIGLQPQYAEAYNNRGTALKDLGQLDKALASYDKALAIQPQHAKAHLNRGNVLLALKQHAAATASYEKAISILPSYAEAYANKGNVLVELRQLQAGIACYDKAIALDPDYAEAYANRGFAQTELQLWQDGADSYEAALKLKPDYKYLLGAVLHNKMKLCDWTQVQKRTDDLVKRIERGEKVSPGFPVLALSASPSVQHKVAQTWANDMCPANDALGAIAKRPKAAKIRVGYFSADFQNHATTHLMAGVFECHDKAQFEWIAFSFGPDIQDDMRRRVSQAFNQFIDVRLKTDKEIAALSRAMGIDIAVDLKGYTQDQRAGIFAYRAAPVQVNYLGYPGTMGADFMDYVIADAVVIPEASQAHFTEKVVCLPHSYFCNSYVSNQARQVEPAKEYTRTQLGLPERGFVFCCFNNNYKITPTTLDSWVRILNQVPGSVLWLFEDNATAALNLRKEASIRGLDPKRLVFAKKMPLPDHLARHKLADLFLDTLPYNAHTTATDALWMGLPLLTLAGEAFASRVADSLLKAIELPELITYIEHAYEARAVELATNAVKLQALKAKLVANKLTTALFDTQLFTRHLEGAYLQMYARCQAGERSESFCVN